MGWSTHRTTEMPAVPVPIGRHRKRQLSRIVVVAVLIMASAGITTAIFSPGVFGWSDGTSAAAPSLPPEPLDALASPGATVGSPSGTRATTKASTPVPPRPTKPALPPAATPLASFEDSVVSLVNAERAKRGCGAVRNDPDLHQAARGHSMDMARYQYHSHTGRDGSDPGARMKAAGYDVTGGWAENIARGYPTPASVMAGWMKSGNHRRNILNCGMRAIGVGAARVGSGDIYWTQDFGGR